jgi:[protein-PII] uridylyltransferase
MSLSATRASVIADRSLAGSAFTAALSDAVDAWLAALYADTVGDRDDVALVAVGGYGRAELCPHSDLDLLLLHEGVDDIESVARALWYPLWDEGAKLGHAVRTVREALDLAADDLETATALLSTRLLAGNADLATRLADQAGEAWRSQAKTWLPRLDETVQTRHRRVGEVAFMLEPDLKSGRGGLRDVQTLEWAFLADRGTGTLEETELVEPYEILLATRVELHRAAGRPGDRLLLEQQDATARALPYADADVMMADVAGAARRIAWHSDEVWVQLLDALRRKRRRLRRPSRVAAGAHVSVCDDRVDIDPDALVTPEVVLTAAVAAATHDARLSPETIAVLERAEVVVPDPWTPRIRELFVDLLRAGHDAIPVVETLDQLGLFAPFIPEWTPNRSRPQRNAYHRFTVDRHLWEAAAEAAKLTGQVDRPDLLVVGSLLHDIGKGYPGDHTEVGMGMIPAIAKRMGFDDADADILVRMCQHHLLLPDAATRRDLDDDDTIRTVAEAAGSVSVLRLLEALTEADSIATGPSAWSAWKAGLVHDLSNRAAFVLDGGDAGELPRNFPSDEDRARMRRGTTFIRGEGGILTAMVIDRPGVFSRIAGAMTLSGLDVLQAAAHSEFGIALAVFRVENSFDTPIDWDRVCRSVDRAVHGRLALAARIDERIRTYSASAGPRQPQPIVETSVTIDNDSSSAATVVEVASRNGIGLLYFVTRALSQCDLDIATAKIQTLGEDVVDSFYVLDRSGRKVDDPEHCAEIQRAVLHALDLALAAR